MAQNSKTGRFKPIGKPKITVADVKQKVENFDPQKAVDEYIRQDPRRHSANLSPKHIYEVDERTETQAIRIVRKFGGIRPFLIAMKAVGYSISRQAVYQWSWPATKKSGTGGLIPTRAWPYIFAAARMYGIFISAEDADAREQHIKKFKAIATVVNGQVFPVLDHRENEALRYYAQEKGARSARRLKQLRKVTGLKSEISKLKKEINNMKRVCKCKQ